MGEAEWVQANASLMKEMGSERWLRQLLDVLNGDIVTAEEVGLPRARQISSAAAGKRKRKKRHHK